MRNLILLTLLISTFTGFSQKKHKALMSDPNINFYDVCKEADLYFTKHNKDIKGSGWMGYQRWKSINEPKYYPSGIRNDLAPSFINEEFDRISVSQPNQLKKKSNGWTEIGPYKIDSITGHYAAGLGRIEDHYVDPNNANTMYLSSRSGGFWKTTDGGLNWAGGSTDFLPATGINTFTVSPTNADSILINVKNSRNSTTHGIYRSIDGGNSWTKSNFNPTTVGFGGLGSSFNIHKVVYHTLVSNLIFIATSKGLYRSDDNLQTFINIYPNSQVTDLAFHPLKDSVIYIRDNSSSNNLRDKILISTDLGLTYSPSNAISGNLSNTSVHLSVSASCPDCVYFASDNGVWKSLNEGKNFTFLSNPSQGCGGFAVNDVDTSHMIYGYVNLEASSNGGKSFTQKTWWSLGSNEHGNGNFMQNFKNSTAYIHADLHPAKSVNGVFYVGTDGLFCKSTDNGNSWEILSNGNAIRENYKLGVSQSNHYRAISGSQDNGTSISTKTGWVEYYGADGMECIIHPLNDDWMIGSFQYGGRRRTTNGGLNNGGVTPANQSGSNIAAWEAPMAYDPNDHMKIYHFSFDVYASDDYGSNWGKLGSPSSFTGTIRQAAIAENNSNIMVISRFGAIDKSIDGGKTFNPISNNLPGYTIQDIAFDPKDDNTIVVVFSRYQLDNSKVFITTNGGLSWNNITYNLGNMPLHSVVIDHSNQSNLYLGAEIGVYTMPKNGSNWNLFNSALPNTTIEELEIVYGSNTLKAATWGRGLWQSKLLNRQDYPAIVRTWITSPPTENKPIEATDQFVSAEVSYRSTISKAYLEWSIDTASFGNVIEMSLQKDSTWVSNSSLPQQSKGTNIYFKVFAIGASQDTTETYKFMYKTQPFVYCTASGTNATTVDYISQVSINNVVNASYKDFYTYYNNLVVDLKRDSTYSILVQLNHAFEDDDPGVWIDYNRNAEFELTEQINMPDYDSTNTSIGVFTVPSYAVEGDTIRLRVRNSYFGVPVACGNDAGEVEDYPVFIAKQIGVNLTELDNSTAKIYPNPTNNELTIDGLGSEEDLSVSIFNIVGQDVLERIKLVSKTNKKLVYKIGNLPEGVYLLMINNEYHKVIVQ